MIQNNYIRRTLLALLILATAVQVVVSIQGCEPEDTTSGWTEQRLEDPGPLPTYSDLQSTYGGNERNIPCEAYPARPTASPASSGCVVQELDVWECTSCTRPSILLSWTCGDGQTRTTQQPHPCGCGDFNVTGGLVECENGQIWDPVQVNKL